MKITKETQESAKNTLNLIETASKAGSWATKLRNLAAIETMTGKELYPEMLAARDAAFGLIEAGAGAKGGYLRPIPGSGGSGMPAKPNKQRLRAWATRAAEGLEALCEHHLTEAQGRFPELLPTLHAYGAGLHRSAKDGKDGKESFGLAFDMGSPEDQLFSWGIGLLARLERISRGFLPALPARPEAAELAGGPKLRAMHEEAKAADKTGTKPSRKPTAPKAKTAKKGSSIATNKLFGELLEKMGTAAGLSFTAEAEARGMSIDALDWRIRVFATRNITDWIQAKGIGGERKARYFTRAAFEAHHGKEEGIATKAWPKNRLEAGSAA